MQHISQEEQKKMSLYKFWCRTLSFCLSDLHLQTEDTSECVPAGRPAPHKALPAK